MSRMDHNPTRRTSFGCPEPLLEKLDEIADREDVSRSGKLRQLVKQEVEENDLDQKRPVLPEHERLADAYQTLHDRAHAPHKERARLSLGTAKNLAFSNDTPKDEVLEEIIKPLEQLGYLSVSPGLENVWVVVRPMRYTAPEDVFDVEPETATA